MSVDRKVEDDGRPVLSGFSFQHQTSVFSSLDTIEDWKQFYEQYHKDNADKKEVVDDV